MIEKNIFQTFLTRHLPGPIADLRDRLVAANPEYRYQFYDDDDILDFIRSEFDAEVAQCYGRLTIGAAKADFWRYLILYKRGGVYLDVDSAINCRLEELILPTDKAVFTRERNPGSFVQWCLICSSGHPVLEKTIERVMEGIHNRTEAKLDLITGPPVMSRAIEQLYQDLKLAQSLYDSDDTEINARLDPGRPDHARFLGYDYEGKCTFKHEFSHLLYEPHLKRKHWSVEQARIPVLSPADTVPTGQMKPADGSYESGLPTLSRRVVVAYDQLVDSISGASVVPDELPYMLEVVNLVADHHVHSDLNFYVVNDSRFKPSTKNNIIFLSGNEREGRLRSTNNFLLCFTNFPRASDDPRYAAFPLGLNKFLNGQLSLGGHVPFASRKHRCFFAGYIHDSRSFFRDSILRLSGHDFFRFTAANNLQDFRGALTPAEYAETAAASKVMLAPAGAHHMASYRYFEAAYLESLVIYERRKGQRLWFEEQNPLAIGIDDWSKLDDALIDGLIAQYDQRHAQFRPWFQQHLSKFSVAEFVLRRIHDAVNRGRKPKGFWSFLRRRP